MGSWMVKSVEEFSFHSWKIIARNEPSSVLRKKKNVSNEMATDTLTQIYSVSYVSGSVWKSYCLLFKSPFLEYVLPRTSSETNGFWAPCSLPAFWHLVYCPSHIQQSKTGSLLGCQVLSALSSLHTPALLTHFLLLLSSPAHWLAALGLVKGNRGRLRWSFTVWEHSKMKWNKSTTSRRMLKTGNM